MNEEKSPILKENAKLLRKNMTNEERYLWYKFLRTLPYKFVRQKIIGNYIVDFYCANAKTVIELDGSQHYSKEGKEADLKRDEYLKAQGITVLRYSNHYIQKNFEAVCNDIIRNIELHARALKGKTEEKESTKF